MTLGLKDLAEAVLDRAKKAVANAEKAAGLKPIKFGPQAVGPIIDPNAVLPPGIGLFEVPPIDPFCQNLIDAGLATNSDGTQRKDGGSACSSTVMGVIPDASKMSSVIISQPQDGSTVDGAKDFTIELNTVNEVAGFFSNANTVQIIILTLGILCCTSIP